MPPPPPERNHDLRDHAGPGDDPYLTPPHPQHGFRLPRHAYLIAATQRTGSTLLCEMLSRTGAAGQPSEFFWRGAATQFIKAWGTISSRDYLQAVFRKCTSPNGVFGAKVMASYWDSFIGQLRDFLTDPSLSDRQVIEQFFPSAKYVFVTRRDKLRQAISHVRALHSNVWHVTATATDRGESLPNALPAYRRAELPSTSAGVAWTEGERAVPLDPPGYDFDAIEQQIEMFRIQEAWWRGYFERERIEPLEIAYEDLVADREAWGRRLVSFLELELPSAFSFGAPALQRMADETTEAWVASYHADRARLTRAAPSEAPAAPQRRSVVRLVLHRSSLLSGVTLWALRLVEWMARHAPEFDARIVVLARPDDPPGLPPTISPEDRRWIDIMTEPFTDSDVRLAALARSLEALAIDVLVPNYCEDVIRAAHLIEERPPRVVGICHSDDPYYYTLLGRYWFLWDGLAAVSQRCLRELAFRLPRDAVQPVYLPYGVPMQAFRPRDVSPQPLRIVYVGRLVQSQKRVLDLIPLTYALVQRGVAFRLFIVGEGPDAAYLHQALAPMAMAEGPHQVRFLGQIASARVQEVLAQSDVFVLTSEFEGTSIAMLEAMAAGVVPVVTDLPSGVPELIDSGRSGVTFPVGAIERLADVLADLSRNRGKLDAIARQAQQRVKELHSLDAMGQAAVAWFRAVLHEERETTFRHRLSRVCARVARTSSKGSWPPTPKESQQRMREVLESVRSHDHGPVLLFGAGHHTQKVAPILADAGAAIVGMVDDDPKLAGQTRWGLPIFSVDQAAATPARALVASSDLHEDRIWIRMGDLRLRRFHPYRLYGDKSDFERYALEAANRRALAAAIEQGYRRIALCGGGFWSRIYWHLWERERPYLSGVLLDASPDHALPGQALREENPHDCLAWLPRLGTNDLAAHCDAILIPHLRCEESHLFQQGLGALGVPVFRAFDYLELEQEETLAATSDLQS